MVIKNFQPKRSEQISFTATFSGAVNFTTFELAAKKNYSDTSYSIYRNLGNGITKISDTTYQITIPTENLEYTTYIYDARVVLDNVVYFPFSGKITVKPTVYEVYNG